LLDRGRFFNDQHVQIALGLRLARHHLHGHRARTEQRLGMSYEKHGVSSDGLLSGPAKVAPSAKIARPSSRRRFAGLRCAQQRAQDEAGDRIVRIAHAYCRVHTDYSLPSLVARWKVITISLFLPLPQTIVSIKQAQVLQQLYQALPTGGLIARIDSGALVPQAQDIAQRELRQRQAAERVAEPGSTQEQLLAEIYRDMPSDEIRRRLAGSDLLALARGVAEQELHLRSLSGGGRGAAALSLKSRLARDQVRGTESVAQRSKAAMAARLRAARTTVRQRLARDRTSIWNLPESMAIQALLAVVLMAVAHEIAFDLWLESWIFGTVILCRIAGKAFPLFGLWAGFVLMGSPLYGLGWMAYASRSGMGDGRPGPVLFTVLAILLVSGLPFFVGLQMVKGATHIGSWDDLDEEMAEERDKVLDRE
jgi:hypothetical protein